MTDDKRGHLVNGTEVTLVIMQSYKTVPLTKPHSHCEGTKFIPVRRAYLHNKFIT